jgi:hypothetical protein
MAQGKVLETPRQSGVLYALLYLTHLQPKHMVLNSYHTMEKNP